MKKILLTTLIAVICLSILVKIDVFNALVMLFLAGVIPGTHIVIPADVMLSVLGTTICLVVLYAATGDMLRSLIARQVAQAKSAKAHLPKRRFSEI